MDELNLSEIGKKLNEVFSSGNRIVFWYDTTGAFEDSVDDLKLGQVKVLYGSQCVPGEDHIGA